MQDSYSSHTGHIPSLRESPSFLNLRMALSKSERAMHSPEMAYMRDDRVHLRHERLREPLSSLEVSNLGLRSGVGFCFFIRVAHA